MGSVCSEYCLHFWEMLGTWFAAIGTIAAVCVSLWLARRSGAVIKVSAGIRQLAYGDGRAPIPHVAITVTNSGERDCTITGAGWKSAPRLDVHAVQDEGPNPPHLPYRLVAATNVTFRIPVDPRASIVEGLASDFIGDDPEKDARLLKVQAWTAVGQLVEATVEPSLSRALVDAKRRQMARVNVDRLAEL